MGAFGSLFAQAFHLSAAERKTLLVAGAAGGMAAIFATPLAAVLLPVELLLFEWKPRSFIPVAASAAVAAALRVPLLGQGPIFPVTPHGALSWPELLLTLAVGVTAGFGSGMLTWLVYASEDLFAKLMGGALGAVEAHWIHVGDTGLWAMISMAAIRGGPCGRLLPRSRSCWSSPMTSWCFRACSSDAWRHRQ